MVATHCYTLLCEVENDHAALSTHALAHCDLATELPVDDATRLLCSTFRGTLPLTVLSFKLSGPAFTVSAREIQIAHVINKSLVLLLLISFALNDVAFILALHSLLFISLALVRFPFVRLAFIILIALVICLLVVAFFLIEAILPVEVLLAVALVVLTFLRPEIIFVIPALEAIS